MTFLAFIPSQRARHVSSPSYSKEKPTQTVREEKERVMTMSRLTSGGALQKQTLRGIILTISMDTVMNPRNAKVGSDVIYLYNFGCGK